MEELMRATTYAKAAQINTCTARKQEENGLMV
jgi:hypothetical protein